LAGAEERNTCRNDPRSEKRLLRCIYVPLFLTASASTIAIMKIMTTTGITPNSGIGVGSVVRG
jgi:hypothetical protein